MGRSVPQYSALWVVLPLLYLSMLVIPNVDSVVHELTPDLAEKLRREKKIRYFVKMDAGPCHNDDPNDVCRFLDKTLWEPLSEHNPQELWTRLDCFRYRDLCNELSTEIRVRSITGHRKVDFLTVAHSDTSPTSRLVEMYRSGDTDPATYVKYLGEMIVQNRPFEAIHPSEIEATVHRRAGKPIRGGRLPLTILVLTIEGFTRPDVWEAFLESSKGEVRVLMHSKSSNGLSIPGVTQVPPVFSHRGTVALVRPVIQLLRFALALGGSSHYVVVSGDSVPLLSAHGMIQQLRYNNQTRFERHSQDQFKSAPEMRHPYKHFYKSKNWIVLDDHAAQFFADPQNDFTNNFEIVAMADEYYWINVATEHNISYSDLPVMYDEWPLAQAARPNILKVVNSKLTRTNGHLFARKVTNDTILELDWLSALKEGSPKTISNEL